MHSAAIHLLRRVREVDAKAMGISPARASALSVLVFGGAAVADGAGRRRAGDRATMSKLVTAMEREGLVRRYPDVNDARAIRIEATAKARRILERGRARRLELLEGLLSGRDRRRGRGRAHGGRGAGAGARIGLNGARAERLGRDPHLRAPLSGGALAEGEAPSSPLREGAAPEPRRCVRGGSRSPRRLAARAHHGGVRRA